MLKEELKKLSTHVHIIPVQFVMNDFADYKENEELYGSVSHSILIHVATRCVSMWMPLEMVRVRDRMSLYLSN